MPTFSDVFAPDASANATAGESSYGDQTESTPPTYDDEFQSDSGSTGTSGTDDMALE